MEVVLHNKIKKSLLGGLLVTAFTFSPINAEAKVKAVNNQVIHICNKKDTPVNLLACAMYAEGRGEGEKGMFAIGNVILNRDSSEDFPDGIHSVVYQKGQFTYLKRFSIRIKDKDSWEKALKVSRKLIYLNDNFPELRVANDITRGATFYKRWDVHPKWSKKMKVVYRYKGHVFYKERK